VLGPVGDEVAERAACTAAPGWTEQVANVTHRRTARVEWLADLVARTQMPVADSEAVMRQALARIRYVAGIPSGLVVAVAATFYLLVNALTAWSAAEAGELGLWATVVVSAAVTTVLNEWSTSP